MRYMKIEWVGEEPEKDDIVAQIREVLGSSGFLSSGFRIEDGLVACENRWVDKVRGALALKWQFKSRVGNTKKSVSK